MSEKKEISIDVIFDRIVTAIRAFFECPDKIITPETETIDINGWDSMSHMVFMLELETEFAIKFEAAEVLDFNKVSEIVEAIFSHKSHGSIVHDSRVVRR